MHDPTSVLNHQLAVSGALYQLVPHRTNPGLDQSFCDIIDLLVVVGSDPCL